MHIGKSYKLSNFLFWTRRKIYTLTVLGTVPVVLYHIAGIQWLVLPWTVVSLLGTATAFIVGFKNTQTYTRTREGQAAWTAIGNTSRVWALMCRDFFSDPGQVKTLVYRHFAWLTALRYQMREDRIWEVADTRHNAEYQRYYNIPERKCAFRDEMLKYIPEEELNEVLSSRDRPSQLLALQSRATKAAHENQELPVAQYIELQRTINLLLGHQGQSSSLKDTPYPRQYSIINTIFVRMFCLLLPFGMLREVDKLNDGVTGFMHGHMIWLVVPFSVLISWMYTSLEQVGESTENPFEGSANDVPISQICRGIEIGLREMLGEKELPPPLLPQNEIAI